MSAERAYHVVVYGATGFTGGLIAEYLAKNAPPALRWAIAGRDRLRLEGIREFLEAIDPQCADVGVLVADSRDWASLSLMTKETQVLLNAVGPYIDHGESVVRACIASGTDYADITGEADFVERVREEYDQAARDAGVRIVHCCGFDSIPSDLGALYTVLQLPEGVPVRMDSFIEFHGTFSGGTWRSAVKAMGRLRDMQRQARRGDLGARPGSDGRRVRLLKPRLHYEKLVHGWAFPLPTVDAYIVRHSAQALDRYGPDFRYSQSWIAPSLDRLVLGAMGVGAMLAIAQIAPLRARLLDVRQSGDGPSVERRAASWFKVTFAATAGSARVVTRVSGGDPGYSETAKMAGESVMCLALDQARLPACAGVVTTAQAMGERLLERLIGAGLRFEVLERG